MARDLWIRDDIRNVLLGLELSSRHTAGQVSDGAVDAYRQGFTAALAAAALSFGIPLAEVTARMVVTSPTTCSPGMNDDCAAPPIRCRAEVA